MSKFLSLGTAQLGLNYGVVDSSELLDSRIAYDLINMACSHSFNHIDTASAYGLAEKRIGDFFKEKTIGQIPITTKIPKYPNNLKTDGLVKVKNWINNILQQSIHKILPAKVDTVLVHYWPDVDSFPGDYVQIVKDICNSYDIFKIGVSVYEVDELVQALRHSQIDHVQIPFNIIDYRIPNSSKCLKLFEQTNCEIHVRSIFLQGLLLSSVDKWPQNIKKHITVLDKLDKCVMALGKKDRVDLIFSYLLSHNWITSTILGAQNIKQLEYLILRYHEANSLSVEEIRYLRDSLGQPSHVFLDPRRWRNG